MKITASRITRSEKITKQVESCLHCPWVRISNTFNSCDHPEFPKAQGKRVMLEEGCQIDSRCPILKEQTVCGNCKHYEAAKREDVLRGQYICRADGFCLFDASDKLEVSKNSRCPQFERREQQEIMAGYAIFHGHGGYECERKQADKILTKRKSYKVVGGVEHSCITFIELEGISGSWNTAMFYCDTETLPITRMTDRYFLRE